MDSSLRKKIVKHIADGISEYRPEGKPIEEIADKILKSVADEGYENFKAKTKELNPTGAVTFQLDEQERVESLMTGQEWYDRFMKELYKFKGTNVIHDISEVPKLIREREVWVEQAAKKAAGL